MEKPKGSDPVDFRLGQDRPRVGPRAPPMAMAAPFQRALCRLPQGVDLGQGGLAREVARRTDPSAGKTRGGEGVAPKVGEGSGTIRPFSVFSLFFIVPKAGLRDLVGLRT